MGFRFRRSIKLGKHTRLNLSKSGVGISTGVKGFRVSAGPKGIRTTTPFRERESAIHNSIQRQSQSQSVVCKRSLKERKNLRA